MNKRHDHAVKEVLLLKTTNGVVTYTVGEVACVVFRMSVCCEYQIDCRWCFCVFTSQVRVFIWIRGTAIRTYLTYTSMLEAQFLRTCQSCLLSNIHLILCAVKYTIKN